MKLAKLLLYILVLIGIFFGGYFRGKNQPTPQPPNQLPNPNPTTSSTQLSIPEFSNSQLQNRNVYIPILMYHYIRDNIDCEKDSLGCSLSVAPEKFSEQIAWLKANGYQTANFSQIHDTKYMIQNTKKSVILTFDDGYTDFYTIAYPILRANNFTATVFMITKRIGTDGFLTESQIQELSENGIEFGSHTVSHVNMSIADESRQYYEANTSQKTLEKILGKPIISFAYPSGFNSPISLTTLKSLKYIYAVTTAEAIANLKTSNPLLLPRLRISGSLTQENFEFLVQNGYRQKSTTTTTESVVQ
ncbi:MAG: polysaccharide deacetylase [Candidatus Berkelbacteria bacterium Licking1014_85]|uniref:Polysaccharide deacetylase n=1 Tax=Candidatus Berkelbacteria bacterium Licking1014_85 TaxID=2017148 RepID=A0A554LL09_9BACT|nr:MAG: polysaccharide deacetylase [Candidatus Berkelbacteria bacterium Licking1014_85]